MQSQLETLMQKKQEEIEQQELLKRQTEENRLRAIWLEAEKKEKEKRDARNAQFRGTKALKWN